MFTTHNSNAVPSSDTSSEQLVNNWALAKSDLLLVLPPMITFTTTIMIVAVVIAERNVDNMDSVMMALLTENDSIFRKYKFD